MPKIELPKMPKIELPQMPTPGPDGAEASTWDRGISGTPCGCLDLTYFKLPSDRVAGYLIFSLEGCFIAFAEFKVSFYGSGMFLGEIYGVRYPMLTSRHTEHWIIDRGINQGGGPYNLFP